MKAQDRLGSTDEWPKLHWLAVMALGCLLGACNSDEACLAYVGGVGPQSSSAHFRNCGDGASRDVECQRHEDTHLCKCLANGTVSREFERNSPFPQQFEIAQDTANAACGWQLHR